jgi:hypothetical protein
MTLLMCGLSPCVYFSQPLEVCPIEFAVSNLLQDTPEDAANSLSRNYAIWGALVGRGSMLTLKCAPFERYA